MKFGAFYHIWFPEVKLHNLVQLFSRIREMGFEGIEITITPDLLKNKELLKNLKDESKQIGIQCIFSTGLSEENSIISSLEERRKKGITFLKSCIELVASFEGDMLAGILYGPWGDFTSAPPTKEHWEWSKEGLWEVAEFAKNHSIFLAIEPANRFETFLLNTAREARQLIHEIGHPQIKLHLDTFQMNIEEIDIKEAILDSDKLLYHFHCCASHRGIPGTDHLDWVGIFRALKRINYQRWMVIESFTPEMVKLPFGKKVAIWKKLADLDDIALEGLRFLKNIEKFVFLS